MWFTAGHVEFDGLNLSQVTMRMMLICVTVCPETKTQNMAQYMNCVINKN